MPLDKSEEVVKDKLSLATMKNRRVPHSSQKDGAPGHLHSIAILFQLPRRCFRAQFRKSLNDTLRVM